MTGAAPASSSERLRRGPCLAAVLFAVALAILVPSNPARASATLTDIGTLGGNFSSATAVNDAGVVVGWAFLPGDTIREAFRWTAAGGMVGFGGPGSRADAINQSGAIAGSARFGAGPEVHAFVRSPAGAITDLGTLGGTTSGAYGINDAGQVVGTSALSGDAVRHAFLWDPATGMTDLGTLGGTDSVAFAINNRGQVAGTSTVSPSNWNEHGFVWSAATGMTDLGTHGEGTRSDARAINDNGAVAGTFVNAYGIGVGFVWNPTTGIVPIITGAPWGSEVNAMNADGYVTGMLSPNAWTYSAFLATTPVDAVVLSGGGTAFGMNATGMIVGDSAGPLPAHGPGGFYHALVWSQAFVAAPTTTTTSTTSTTVAPTTSTTVVTPATGASDPAAIAVSVEPALTG